MVAVCLPELEVTENKNIHPSRTLKDQREIIKNKGGVEWWWGQRVCKIWTVIATELACAVGISGKRDGKGGDGPHRLRQACSPKQCFSKALQPHAKIWKHRK